jgi:hypothetical protein
MTASTAVVPPALTIRSSIDLLSVIPHLLGYRPHESIVVLAIRHDGTLGFIANTPLETRFGAGLLHACELISRQMRADSPSHVVVAAFTQSDDGGNARATLSALRSIIPCPIEAWHIGPRSFRRLSDGDCDDAARHDAQFQGVSGHRAFGGDASGCDDSRQDAVHDVRELESTLATTELTFAGIAPAKDRESAFRITPAAVGPRRSAQAAARRLQQRLDSETGQELIARIDAVVAEWTSATQLAAGDGRRPEVSRDAAAKMTSPRDGHASMSKATTCLAPDGVSLVSSISPATLGRIAVVLADSDTRDRIMFTCFKDAVASGTESLPMPGCETLDAIVDPKKGCLPAIAVVGPAIAVLEAVVAHAARHRKPPALALLGFLHWWNGRGGQAGYVLAEALDIDPDHRLARLMSRAIAEGIAPGWVHAARARGGQRH